MGECQDRCDKAGEVAETAEDAGQDARPAAGNLEQRSEGGEASAAQREAQAQSAAALPRLPLGGLQDAQGETARVLSGKATAGPRRKRKRRSDGLGLLTVNVTSIGSLYALLTSVGRDIHVILVQEHKVFAGKVKSHSAKLLKLGWRTFWCAATKGPNGGASGGTMVMVRVWMDAWALLDTADVSEARAAHAMIRTMDLGEFVVYSCYGDCYGGVSSQSSTTLFVNVLRHARAHGLPTLAGGDWNATPAEVQESFAKQIGGRVHYDPSGPTCVTTTKESTYDFYVTTNKLAQAMGTIEICHEIPLATHKAVKLGFLHGVTQRRVLVEQRIPKVSGATPIGPRLPPVDWSEAILSLEAGLETVDYAQGSTATGERRAQGREALEAAYPKFKLAMQNELQDLFGLEQLEAKDLARKRELHWRPMAQVLHCKGASRPTPSRAFLWAAGLLDQLGSLCLREGPVDAARQAQIRTLAGRALGSKKTPFDHHAPDAKSSWMPQLKRIGRIAVGAVEGKGTYRAAGGRAVAWAKAARCCYEIALPVEW